MSSTHEADRISSPGRRATICSPEDTGLTSSDGADSLYAGPGNDLISAVGADDSLADVVIDCGSGVDTAYVDATASLQLVDPTPVARAPGTPPPSTPGSTMGRGRIH